MIVPSRTTTAPTGTSPRSCAARASASASRIQRSASCPVTGPYGAGVSLLTLIALASRLRLAAAENGVGFDLNQPVGVDQTTYLDHPRRGLGGRERFSVP